MQLELIKNTDENKRITYKIARVVYSETRAISLPAVEAITSMIKNISCRSGRAFEDIANDADIFPALRNKEKVADIDINSRGFQMCLRVVNRMIKGGLIDACNGATRFHHAEEMPTWAQSIGYVADIDGLLFYA